MTKPDFDYESRTYGERDALYYLITASVIWLFILAVLATVALFKYVFL